MEFDFCTIPADRYDEVIDHLRGTFFVDEPVCKSVRLIDNEELMLKYCYATMAEGLSVMALTKDNQIAGVRLCGITRPGDSEQSLAKLADIPDNGTVRIFRLLCEENIRLDLFARLGCDQIFELRIGSVGGPYRRRGLAHELLMHAYQRARDAGAQYVKSEASGLFSQRVLENNGFEVFGEIKYAERLTADGAVMFPNVEAPHVSMKILIKKLE